MTGYESITLLCTIVTTAITVVSFVFAIPGQTHYRFCNA